MESGVNGFCRRGQHFSQLFTVGINTLKLNIRQIAGFIQKLQPVFRFRAFLQCNVDLCQKSFLLMAHSASARFAPMLVPHRRSCLERMNSRFSSHKYRYRFTIRTENRLLFFLAVCSITPLFTLYLFLLQLTASMAMTSSRPGISSPTSS